MAGTELSVNSNCMAFLKLMLQQPFLKGIPKSFWKKMGILTPNSKMIYLGRKIGLVYRGITHKMETCGL